MSRTILADAPGWVQRGLSDSRLHLLTGFPPPARVGDRVSVWCGSLRLTRWSMFFSYLYAPLEPCLDCDRARQAHRIQQIAARLAS